MDFNKLQKKLILRLTSPIELLYVISSHWFLILFLTGIGMMVMIAKVKSEPPIYSASTVLMIDPKEMISIDGMKQIRSNDANFVQNQVQLLQSETTLTTMVNRLGYAQIELQEVGDEESMKQAGLLQKIYRKVSTQVEYFIGKLTTPSDGTPDEKNLHRALNLFRRRSEVIYNPRVSTQVRLRVWGTMRSGLIAELLTWVIAYRNSIDESVGETWLRYLDDSISKCTKDVKEASEKLEQFRKANSNVSETMQKVIQENFIKRQIIVENLKAQAENLNSGNGELAPLRPSTPTTSGEKDLLDILTTKLRDLNLKKIDLLGSYPQTSIMITEIEQMIKNTEDHILSLQNPQDLVKSGEDPEKSRSERLKRALEVAKDELETALNQQVSLEGKMVDLKQLQDDYRYKLDKKRSLEQRLEIHIEYVRNVKQIQVQVVDQPSAGTTPINSFSVLRVSYGFFGGLCLGFFLSFLLEFFYPRIRFKRDVIEELGLEVIGVFPKK